MRVKGGVKFYNGAAGAARSYLESDRSRVDDYYLAEGAGLAAHYAASPGRVEAVGVLDGDGYERWVAGYDTDAVTKGRLRQDARGLRFVEVVVNGPKTWSLAAALHPDVADAYDAAQERAAVEIIGWVAEHATTRVGPQGRQVQVPVERVEAALVRHYTSRADDPHRHLHLQINARVYAAGGWRGIHTMGMVDSTEAINGIGHAAVMCDPEFRAALAAHGLTLDPDSGEVVQLKAYVGEFSARTSQISRNIDTYEAAWRTENPGQEPGRGLHRAWDRRAWADARPDKVVPADGADLTRAWVEQLHELGYRNPAPAATAAGGAAGLDPTPVGAINRDAVAHLVISRLGAKRSAWNAADIRGQVEKILAAVDVVADPRVRRELAEDLTARTVAACTPLLRSQEQVKDANERPGDVPGDVGGTAPDVTARPGKGGGTAPDVTTHAPEPVPGRVSGPVSGSVSGGVSGSVPEHVRALTSDRVLGVEAELVDRIVARATVPGRPAKIHYYAGVDLDRAQRRAIEALAGSGGLFVIEGAAGAGKTTTLAATAEAIEQTGRGMRVVTPPSRRLRSLAVSSPRRSRRRRLRG